MGKKRRSRTRGEILAKREADSRRRSRAKPVDLLRQPAFYNPGRDILFNPLKFRPTLGAVTLVKARR